MMFLSVVFVTKTIDIHTMCNELENTHVLYANMQLELDHEKCKMASVSAERISQRLKTTHPKLFMDICYSHAGRLLEITDRHRIMDLLGYVQGPLVEPSVYCRSTATMKKPFKGIKFCLH